MFDFAKLQEVRKVSFDGVTPHDVIVMAVNVWDVGEYYDNTTPTMQILAEEAITRTPVKWTLKFAGIAPRYYTDKETGKRVQMDSERVAACKALSKALGWEYTSDIKKLYLALTGSCIRVVVSEDVSTDDNGDPRRNDQGEIIKYQKVRKYLAPSKEKEPSMPERIAEAEAKRARKGKRAYPGNEGEA